MLFYLPANVPFEGNPWSAHFEMRGRFERRDDADFRTDLSDNKTTHLTRGRVALTYAPEPGSMLKLVFQYFGNEVRPTTGGESSIEGKDLIEAQISRSAGGSTLTIGRQKINLGAQRLIGALEWANSSRSWLGARLKTRTWDLFWGELESNPVENSRAQIGMASMNCGLGETSVLYKHDASGPSRTSVATIDYRATIGLGAARATGEFAYQWGRKGGMDHDAWAATVHGEFDVSPSLKIYGEGNLATGGDGSKSRAFDNLYPTNHLYYGGMDLQGWSNLKGFAVGATWKASSALTFDVSYHDFSLYDKAGGWYGAAGVLNKIGGVPAIDPSGTSGAHIGNEVDFVARFRANESTQLEAGYSLFSPGGFVESFVGGPSTRGAFAYVQVSKRF